MFQRTKARDIYFFMQAHAHHHHPSYRKGPLISMCPHVNIKGGIIGKFLVANLTAEAGSVFGLAERSVEMGQHMLLQGSIGDKSAAARPHWTFERCLACVGQPMEVKALLGHAPVAT